MARDYNKDYDNSAMTWDMYHKILNDEGLSDEQIKQELKGTKWDTQGKEYGKWRDDVPGFVQDTPEATKKYIDANPTSAMVPNDEPKVEAQVEEQTVEAPVEQPSADDVMKETRKQYANDNEGYKKALADKGIETGDSRSKVRSIQQAYYDGLIDKGTRDYMMADALAKFARNTGRDIGNIGAQYTGGTINNNYEEADWNKRNDELFKQQTSSEAADVKGSDKAMERAEQQANLTGKNLGNEKADISLGYSRQLLKMADEEEDPVKKQLLQYMASKAANGLSHDELIALGLIPRDGGDKTPEEIDKETSALSKEIDSDITPEEWNQIKPKYEKKYQELIDSGVDERNAEIRAGQYANGLIKENKKRREAEAKAKEAEAKRQQNLANAFKDKIAAVDTFKKLTNKKTVDGSKFDLNRYRTVRDVVQEEHPEMFDGSVADADAQALIAKMYYGVQ